MIRHYHAFFRVATAATCCNDTVRMPLARGLYYSCRAAASGTPDEATTTTGTTTTTTTMMTMTGTTNTQAATTTTTTITTTASKTNTTTTTTTRTTKKTTSTSTTTMLTNTAEHGDCGDGDDAGMTIRYRTDADPYDIMVVKNKSRCMPLLIQQRLRCFDSHKTGPKLQRHFRAGIEAGLERHREFQWQS